MVVPPLEKVTESAAAREITEHWRSTIRQEKRGKRSGETETQNRESCACQ